MLKKILKLIFQNTPFSKFRCALLRMMSYQVGENVYVSSDLVISDLSRRKGNVILGDRVSIGPRVTLITDSSPNNSKLTRLFPIKSGVIEICDDTWLGAGVIVLPNIKIGRCSVIAAGAVVTKNIPEFSIVAGVPGKVINKIEKKKYYDPKI